MFYSHWTCYVPKSIHHPWLHAKPYNYPANSDNCEAPHCAVLSNLLLLSFVKSKCSRHRQFVHRHSRWEWDFPHPSGPVLELNQPSFQWVPDLSRWKTAGEWHLPPTPSIADVKEWAELYLCCTVKHKGGGTPFQASDRSWGFKEGEAPIFQDNGHTKVTRLLTLSNGRLYVTGSIPGIHFC